MHNKDKNNKLELYDDVLSGLIVFIFVFLIIYFSITPM